ncbi:putative protein Networked (NET), actin-binding (NAB) [Helianthus annuus]|uniref:NAB domain-containing protein n=1 Tax=Helianthus annuus TaxID=4232 RepID=A0A251TAA9_HELAN|nr:protein NETWORKED 1D [Helianthus annuus]KAF5782429.1 putative protein Networked (NET), actin-binding (NAB) [Helianthus annuus]KAJ0689729.1 putative protein Networked (NET), actin-binding (NAB) [Helianthus annuus]KAJ0875555.1 putative protein Networked (NET), actin-binding (NAB) [Helianthus annuus]
MASLSKADSRRMYSWWWNSHISPKNSKWLQENLTDVDIKVKAMIKLIEEDADSFARRAEMYYKKRPELMKLVEELYRAYRALAERYDHATGALRQAHKTMSEAFPNQVPAGCDDSTPNSTYDSDPQTPESKTIACLDPNDSQKDRSTGTARKALSFSDSEDASNKLGSRSRNISQSEDVTVNDKEIVLLKEALAKLEDEKEAGMKQYVESLDKLSKLESEILKSQEDSKELTDRASKAEDESQNLKEMLQRLEVEKEESLELYRQAVKKIEEIDEPNLKEEIKRLKDERDTAYDRYEQSMNMQSDLEKKLREAENEIETLKLAIVKLTKEKEAKDVLYQQCMETISSLELRLVCAEEETERLKAEIDNGLSLLKAAEEQRLMLEKSNKSLYVEMESMGVRISTQNQEITEKQKELGRLWTCIQEERIRFVEAETAFQTLQQIHEQSQEELRSMAGELQNWAQVLRDIEARNEVLEGEIQKKIEENKNLSEVNLSSAVSLKEMQSEISNLKEANGKLEEEVDLRVDQRNALQQEIYCLKEELNELNKKHGSIMQQVAYVGLNPESFGLSVKELKDEKSNLNEELQKEKTAKAALLEKLEIMGQLLERNVVLENSLSDLGDELEGVRGKLKALEDAYRSLSEEKSNLAVEKANLLGQLQVTTDNLSQVSEKNTVLENSLFDAHVKLEVLKQKSKSFEDSCRLLADEKSVLITEKGTLVSQMEITDKKLNNLESKYADLEDKYAFMEKERESTLRKVRELNVSLALRNEEHVTFVEMNDRQLQAMRSQIQLLQEESRNKNEEYEHELDKSFGSEIEILILLNCAQDLEEKNFSLLNDCRKLQEASKLSESLIRVLKQEKTENRLKIKSLSDQNDRFKNGMHQLLKAAGLSLHPGCENGREQTCFDNIQQEIEGKKRALIENEDENMKLLVETTILVTLLNQFKTKLVDLEAEKCVTEHELGVRAEKILGLQNAVFKISETNEELRSKVIDREINESGLRTQLENIQCELSVVQEAFRMLQMENMDVLKEKKLLLNDNVQIKNKICVLEEENEIFLNEILSQGIVSHTLKSYVDEKHEDLSSVQKKLRETVNENVDLRKTLEKSEREFRTVQSICDKLSSHLANGNNMLQSKETELTILANDKKELLEIVAELRKENDIAFNEVLSQGILNQILKNYIDEKHEELSSVAKKLEETVNENVDLRKTLENSKCEFRTVQSVCNKLNLDLANGNNMLQSKETELTILANDKKELTEIVADLRRENDIVYNEALSQGILSQTLKDYIDEKHEELSSVTKELEETVKENVDLRKTLEKSEHEFRMVQSDCDKLNLDLVNGNNLLQLKEKELKIIENDKNELSEIVADLRRENDIVYIEALSQCILSQTLKNYIDEKHEELSSVEKKLEETLNENVDLRKTLEKSEREFRTIQSVCDKLNLDLVNGSSLLQLKEKELTILENDKKELSEIVANLKRENSEVKTTNDQQRKQILKFLEDNDRLTKQSQMLAVKMQQLTEKQETTEEKLRLLEAEGSLIYGDLQTSIISQVLLEQKISELTDVCLSLQDEKYSKDLNTELLKERSNVLECENADLKGRLAAYGPALDSLRDSIVSLENHTCVKTKVSQSENENEKGGESATMERDAFVELQDLQSKVKVIEMTVTQQKLDSDAKLESAMMQIEELSQQKSSGRPNGKTKSTSEISEADPKDIMLDQASECSSYGVSKRGLIEGEIWETTDDSKTVFKHHPTASEVSLDNILEVSRRFEEPQEDANKKKVLERLNSDVLRLTNLQITIEDLKRKVDMTLKSRRGKAMIECKSLKGQLTEADSAIEKLYELNARLVQHIEGNADKSSTSESGETESMRRKKVSEQARRVSENIGRMQIEIQKIQFKLLKLDDENEPTGKKRFFDTKKRVVLKDYLYAGGRTRTTTINNNRRKKGHFCACVEPSTKGD